jgi:hypothetical protein
VKTSHFDIQGVLTHEGIIALRDHPELVGPIRWLVRRGDLHSVLPGVYAPRPAVHTFDTRIRGSHGVGPKRCSGGSGGSTCLLLAHYPSSIVTCALKHHRQPQLGFHFSRRQVPAELVVSRARLLYTSPALTALDLCESLGGDAIDEALRTRATKLKHLHRALELTSSRIGNAERRRMLLDSTDEPWSAAERRFHRLLRVVGITAWNANRPLLIGGSLFFIDVAFRHIKLAIENRRPALPQRLGGL